MGKTYEIDEAEFNNAKQLQATVQKLMAHPKAALLVEQARKMVEPDAPTPRLDQDKIANEPLTKMQEKIDALQKKIDEDSAERSKNEKLGALQKIVEEGNSKLLTQGWTPKGIEALTEFREKEGIINPLLAAPAYENMHGAQVAPVTPSSRFGNWDFTDVPKEDEGYAKKLLDTKGESESLVMQEAMKTLKEFQGNRR